MDFVPYRELRNEPAALRKKLEEQGELIVTVDGKPFAVMVDLQNNESLEEILKLVTRLRAQRAVQKVHTQARKEGLDKLSGEQINKVIKKSRVERK